MVVSPSDFKRHVYIFFPQKIFFCDPQKFLKRVATQYFSRIDIFLYCIFSVHWASAKVILVIITWPLIAKLNYFVKFHGWPSVQPGRGHQTLPRKVKKRHIWDLMDPCTEGQPQFWGITCVVLLSIYLISSFVAWLTLSAAEK